MAHGAAKISGWIAKEDTSTAMTAWIASNMVATATADRWLIIDQPDRFRFIYIE